MILVDILAVGAYPIFGWLEQAVTNSSVLTWLVEQLSFVQSMLPGAFQNAATLMVTGSLM